jgi:hypothetical protein
VLHMDTLAATRVAMPTRTRADGQRRPDWILRAMLLRAADAAVAAMLRQSRGTAVRHGVLVYLTVPPPLYYVQPWGSRRLR